MDEKIDNIIKLSGNQNRYQYFILFLTFFLWINTCFLAVSIPLLEKNPEVKYINEEGKEVQTQITYEICDNYKYTLIEEPHMSWVYDFGIYCDKVKIGLIGTFTFIGNGSGALFFPLITRFLTHKPNIILSLALFSLTIGACTFLPYYWAIMAIIIFTGTFGNLCCYSSIVLVEEVISSSSRSIFGSIINIGFSFSGVIYVLLFYWLNNWLYVFYFLIGFSFLIGVLYLLFVFDSPRVFIIQKNIDKTLYVLRGIAKFNNKLIEFEEKIKEPEHQEFLNEIGQKKKEDKEIDQEIEIKPTEVYDENSSRPLLGQIITDEEMNKKKDNEITALSLFKYSSIRTKFLVLSLLWFLTSGVYNGIAIGAKNFSGNMYLNIILLYLTEAVSYFVFGLLINIPKLGRIGTLVLMYIISLSCLIVLYFTQEYDTVTFIFNLIARFCISGVYTTYYTFALENYPTPVRNIGFGINALFANLGAMIIPLIIEQVNHSTILLYYTGILFGCTILLYFTLKETVGLPMPETIEEMENESNDKRA